MADTGSVKFTAMMPPYVSQTDMRGGGYRTDEHSGYNRAHAPGLMVSSRDSGMSGYYTHNMQVAATPEQHAQVGPYVYHHVDAAPASPAHPGGTLLVPVVSYVFSDNGSTTRHSYGDLTQNLKLSSSGSSKAAWAAGPGIRRTPTYMQQVTHAQEQALHDKLKHIQQQIRLEELEKERQHRESLRRRWPDRPGPVIPDPARRRHTDGWAAAQECQVLTAAQVEQLLGHSVDKVKLVTPSLRDAFPRPSSPTPTAVEPRHSAPGNHSPPVVAPNTTDAIAPRDVPQLVQPAPPAPTAPPAAPAAPAVLQTPVVAPDQIAPQPPADPRAATDLVVPQHPSSTVAPAASTPPTGEALTQRAVESPSTPQPTTVGPGLSVAVPGTQPARPPTDSGAGPAPKVPDSAPVGSQGSTPDIELKPPVHDKHNTGVETPGMPQLPTAPAAPQVTAPASIPHAHEAPATQPAAPVALGQAQPQVPGATLAHLTPGASNTPPAVSPAHQTPRQHVPDAAALPLASPCLPLDVHCVHPAEQGHHHGHAAIPAAQPARPESPHLPYPEHVDSPVGIGIAHHQPHPAASGLHISVGSVLSSHTFILSPTQRQPPGYVGWQPVVPSCVVQGQPLPPVPQLRDHDLSRVPGSPKAKSWAKRTYRLQRPLHTAIHAAPSPARVAAHISACAPPWSPRSSAAGSTGYLNQPPSPTGSMAIQLRNGAVLHAPVWDSPAGSSASKKAPRGPRDLGDSSEFGHSHAHAHDHEVNKSAHALLRLLQAVKELKGSGGAHPLVPTRPAAAVQEQHAVPAPVHVAPAIPWSAVERKRAALAGQLASLKERAQTAEPPTPASAKLAPVVPATPQPSSGPGSVPVSSSGKTPSIANTVGKNVTRDDSSSDEEATARQPGKGRAAPRAPELPQGSKPTSSVSKLSNAVPGPPPLDVLSVPYSTLHPEARLDTALAEVLRPRASGAVAQVFNHSQRPVPKFDGVPVRTSMRLAWGSKAEGEQRSHVLKEAEAVMAERQAEEDAREQAYAEGAEKGLSKEDVDALIEEERVQQEADIKRAAEQAQAMRAQQESEAPPPLTAQQRRREERRIQQDYNKGPNEKINHEDANSSDEEQCQPRTAAPAPPVSPQAHVTPAGPQSSPPYGTYANPSDGSHSSASITFTALTHERTVRDRLLHLEHQAHNMKQSGALLVQPVAWAAEDKELARIAGNMDDVAQEDREERQALADRQAETEQQAEEERQALAKAWKASAAEQQDADDEPPTVKDKKAEAPVADKAELVGKSELRQDGVLPQKSVTDTSDSTAASATSSERKSTSKPDSDNEEL